jgi:hypothetical protein
MARSPEYDAWRDSEQEQISDWRIKSLEEAGIGTAVSQLIAMSPSADIHVVIKAKEAGCPDHLLLEIFDETATTPSTTAPTTSEITN